MMMLRWLRKPDEYMSEKKLQNYPIAKKENESRRIKPNTKVKNWVSFILTLKKSQIAFKKIQNFEFKC